MRSALVHADYFAFVDVARFEIVDCVEQVLVGMILASVVEHHLVPIKSQNVIDHDYCVARKCGDVILTPR